MSADIDALVLGCTHYPLAEEAFSRVLGPQVRLIDEACHRGNSSGAGLDGTGTVGIC